MLHTTTSIHIWEMPLHNKVKINDADIFKNLALICRHSQSTPVNKWILYSDTETILNYDKRFTRIFDFTCITIMNVLYFTVRA